jgi:hypothetical protein
MHTGLIATAHSGDLTSAVSAILFPQALKSVGTVNSVTSLRGILSEFSIGFVRIGAF